MLYLLGVVLIVTSVSSASIEEARARMALYNPDLFEGDILGIDPHDRNSIAGERHRWPNKTIPYILDKSVGSHIYLINLAMQEYETKTCLKFKERTTEKNYVYIFAGIGCYSYIGMINDGKQDMSLGSGCMYKGTIVHEFGHAIGFFHEQSRSDRDEYLTIYWDNIKKGAEKEFQKLKPHENILYNAFDYKSIMLYGNYAFSKDMHSKTMVAKNGEPLKETYVKSGLTDKDIERVKKMYHC